MSKRLSLSLVLAAVLTFLIAVPVLAGYYSFLLTENTGTSYDQIALNLTFDIDGLVDQGFISASGLDTRVTDAQYNVLPHMLAQDKILWSTALPGNATTQFIFYTGQAMMSSFPTITGYGGYVTLADNSTFEPGDHFAFGVSGYIDTTAGANKSIIRKDGAILFAVDTVTDGKVTFAVTGGNSTVATNVTSDWHTFMIYSDTSNMWMEVDDVMVSNVTASSVPDTANQWVLFENNVMPYVSYYGEWVVT